jgi:hypothetical protein
MKLISDRHAQMYRDHYAESAEPEPRPNSYLERIENFALEIGAKTVLDYGCGRARGVSRFSKLNVWDYDPGVPGCDRSPPSADLVVSIHMLEHVEPDHLIDVVSHMILLARKGVFVVVSCEESTKTLPDGSPWHSLVLSPVAWRLILWDLTPTETIKPAGREFAAYWRRR